MKKYDYSKKKKKKNSFAFHLTMLVFPKQFTATLLLQIFYFFYSTKALKIITKRRPLTLDTVA